MSDQSTEKSDYRIPGGTGFASGNPGRPRGIKDRRTKSKEAFLEFYEAGDSELNLPPLRKRIAELLTGPDLNVRATVEKFFFDHAYGKAKESVDVFHRFEAIDEAAEMMEMEGVWQGRDAAHRIGDDAGDGRANLQ